MDAEGAREAGERHGRRESKRSVPIKTHNPTLQPANRRPIRPHNALSSFRRKPEPRDPSSRHHHRINSDTTSLYRHT